ncbi:fad dependent oxidoreductase [Moniliophthora roreri MCA 2997]|uniref:Fad dependent oxidoreductase n=1 Tax=Moniliophthora roreri (strain MCA 2997) TaxID=1381753 RepID=V2XGQ7_MONRO|nr:fad dependent oxidoreductase [Moniliophthora roreri MCA 2997]
MKLHLISLSTFLVFVSVSCSPLQSPLLQQQRTRARSSLPVQNATTSFWFTANPLAKEGSEGPLTREADVCIIGSGITGASIAYHLAGEAEGPGVQQPLRVVVLEARDFCSGATGRNGGHLTPYPFKGFKFNQATYGTQEAIKSFLMETRTTAEMIRVIEEHGMSGTVDLVKGGHITLFENELDPKLVETMADYVAAKAAGIDLGDVEWLAKENVNETFGAPYPAATWAGNNIWPLKFATQLFYIATRRNPSNFTLKLHTHTPVTAVEPLNIGDKRWSLQTPRGSISCRYVVHATNAYAGHLIPHMNGQAGILPTRGQVVAVRATRPLSKAWRKSWGGLDMYWFPRPQEDLVILGGGRMSVEPPYELTTDDSTVSPLVGRTLRAFLPRVFEGSFEKGGEVEMEWTGIMGYTRMTDPFVGPLIDPFDPRSTKYEGQFMSAGYTGHGMPRAFSCAEAIASMIASEMKGSRWTIPEWLPERYLTWNRGVDGLSRK